MKKNAAAMKKTVEQTEEQNVEDYYSGTDIEKMEEIARQVPLSRLERPKWDIETMQKAGFLDVSCDEEVWKEVWTEEEIINNSTSPIFLLTGRKRDAFHLKNVTVQPGKKWQRRTGTCKWRYPASGNCPAWTRHRKNNADHGRCSCRGVCGDSGCDRAVPEARRLKK